MEENFHCGPIRKLRQRKQFQSKVHNGCIILYICELSRYLFHMHYSLFKSILYNVILYYSSWPSDPTSSSSSSCSRSSSWPTCPWWCRRRRTAPSKRSRPSSGSSRPRPQISRHRSLQLATLDSRGDSLQQPPPPRFNF